MSADRLLVLVVDQDPHIREMLCWVFAREGMTVAVMKPSPRLEDLLRIVLANIPSVLLVDVRFAPSTDNWRALGALRRDPRTSALPIVVLTTDIHIPAEARAALHGLRIVTLTMPMHFDDLRAAMDDAIELSRSGDCSRQLGGPDIASLRYL